MQDREFPPHMAPVPRARPAPLRCLQAAEAVERKEGGCEPKCRVDFLREDASNALKADSALPSSLLSKRFGVRDADDPRRYPLDLFMLSALQPVLKQRFLEAARAAPYRQDRKPARLASHSPCASPGNHELSGFPILSLHRCEMIPKKFCGPFHLTDPAVPLDIVLHTPGGLVLAACKLHAPFHKHKGKVTAFRAALRHVRRYPDRSRRERDRP